MRIPTHPMFFLLLSFLIGSGFSAPPQAPAEGPERIAALESALRECAIADISKGEPGRTSPWVVRFADGCAVRSALFRHVDRRRPQPMADSYKYDIAAYELTKLLGVEFIPPVVEREVDGQKGTLQVYLENCIRERDRRRKKLEPPDAQAFHNAMEELKVFASLAYDDCYNLNDLYIHLEDWRVCRVDFSEAFAPMQELLPGCKLTVCSKRLYKGLLELDGEAVREKLAGYLSEEEIAACLFRKNLILEKIDGLITENGEANVLF